MLSSTVSLSSSKSFAGLFYIGTRVMLSTVLAGFSDSVKNGLSATRTTEIILAPTKCVLSNSNISNPYVAAMGYATVILITLFLILRAKGFSSTSACSPGPSPPPTPPSPEYPVPSASKSLPGGAPPTHNHSGMGSEPPSPPPDPGSDSADDTPRRSPWWLLLLLILLAAGSYIYFTRNSDSSVVLAKTIGGQIARTMEQCLLGISNAWTAAVSATRIYMSRHGWRIVKILLLGFATHGVCFLVFAILRRLASTIDPKFYAVAFLTLPSMLVMTFSSPHLRWCVWLEYYNGYRTGNYPSIRGINSNASRLSSYLSSLVASHVDEVSVIGGVAVAHAIIVCLRGSVWFASGLPLGTKVILAALSRPPAFCAVVGICFSHSILICFLFLLSAASAQYNRLNPTVKQHLWQWFSCPKSRESIRVTFSVLAQRHQQWKADQIADFYELLPGFKYAFVATFKASLQIWSNMPIFQKLLIIAPVILFHGHLYIMPVARSLSRRVSRLIRTSYAR